MSCFTNFSKMNIIVLGTDFSRVTGGQVYDSLLYKTILDHSTHKFEFFKLKSYANLTGILKLTRPFFDLYLVHKVKYKDICFWSSSLAFRHFFLLLFIRIFYPKVKCYVIHHHYQYEMEVGIRRLILKFFEVGFLRLSNFVIIPSPYVLAMTKTLLPIKKIKYIEISFEENEISIKRKTSKGDLLYIGTIEPRKGLHLLIESLFLLKNEDCKFTLNLVGKVVNNEYHCNLLKKVALYGLEKNVLFHGRVSNEVLHNLLSRAELFAFPSLLEGYGMVIMEAMSYGVPVVAFNNSAMPFLIKDGYNGLLAKNKDTADFKKLVARIICNTEYRNNLSNGALATFNNSRRAIDFVKDVRDLIEKL